MQTRPRHAKHDPRNTLTHTLVDTHIINSPHLSSVLSDVRASSDAESVCLTQLSDQSDCECDPSYLVYPYLDNHIILCAREDARVRTHGPSLSHI